MNNKSPSPVLVLFRFVILHFFLFLPGLGLVIWGSRPLMWLGIFLLLWDMYLSARMPQETTAAHPEPQSQAQPGSTTMTQVEALDAEIKKQTQTVVRVVPVDDAGAGDADVHIPDSELDQDIFLQDNSVHTLNGHGHTSYTYRAATREVEELSWFTRIETLPDGTEKAHTTKNEGRRKVPPGDHHRGPAPELALPAPSRLLMPHNEMERPASSRRNRIYRAAPGKPTPRPAVFPAVYPAGHTARWPAPPPGSTAP